MQVKTITKYVTDDGYEFDRAEDAYTRENALAILANIKAGQEVYEALVSSCEHALVAMVSHQGTFQDMFRVECMCCKYSFTIPHTDAYWKERYQSGDGIYER